MTVTLNQTIQTQFRTIDGLSIRFAESERAGDDALLLNPSPEISTPSSRPGLDSRLVSPIIGLVWVLVVSRVLLTRSPATRAGW